MGKVKPDLGAVATAGNRNVQIGDLKEKKTRVVRGIIALLNVLEAPKDGVF